MSSPFAQMNTDLHDIIRDYNEFELCMALGITPEELGKRPRDQVEKWMTYLSVKQFGETFRQAQMMGKMLGG